MLDHTATFARRAENNATTSKKDKAMMNYQRTIRKAVYASIILVGVALSVTASAGLITITATDNFSGTQGQDGLYYGAVTHPNYSTFVTAWTEFPNYSTGGSYWYNSAYGSDASYRTVSVNTLRANHTVGPGLYWEVDKAYAIADFTGGRTGGTSWATFAYYWDASEDTYLNISAGNAYAVNSATIYNVEAGDRFAVFMNTGNGSGVAAPTYSFSITVPEPASIGLLSMGLLFVVRRRNRR